MFRNYFESHSYTMRRINFSYLEEWYSGPGFLDWQPGEYFRLRALTEPRRALPSPITFFKPRVLKDKNYKCIRGRFKGDAASWIAFPKVPLTDLLQLVTEEVLDIRLGHAVCSFPVPYERKEHDLRGQTLLWGLKDATFPMLPGKMKRTVSLDGKAISESYETNGLRINEGGLELTGLLEETGALRCVWRLSKELNRQQSYELSSALRDALSLMTGRDLSLLYNRVDTSRREYTEIWKKQSVRELSIFAPLGIAKLEKRHFLDLDLLVKLTLFFSQASAERVVIRRILGNLSEAAALSDEAGELLVGVTIEGAVRAAVDVKGNFSAQNDFSRFRRKYNMSKKWIPIFHKAADEWSAIRHPRAHPRWTDENRQEHELRLNRIYFLSRLLGYMILAMAGISDLEPEFIQLFSEDSS